MTKNRRLRSGLSTFGGAFASEIMFLETELGIDKCLAAIQGLTPLAHLNGSFKSRAYTTIAAKALELDQPTAAKELTFSACQTRI
jgi:hypothetical protein